jgi:hypothetical protein
MTKVTTIELGFGVEYAILHPAWTGLMIAQWEE